MQKLKINIDLDDVLNNLSPYWMQVHYEKTGEKLKASEWELHRISKFGDLIYSYLTEPEFFYNAPLKEGASKIFEYLGQNAEHYDYTILSHCTHEAERFIDDIRDQKTRWLTEHFNEDVASRLILTPESKGKFPADIIIDDKPKNLVESTKCKYKLLVRADHNRTHNKHTILEDFNINVDVINNVGEAIKYLELWK